MRERAIKFLSTKLKTLPEDVMTKEVEDYVFAETKKVRVFSFAPCRWVCWTPALHPRTCLSSWLKRFVSDCHGK